MALAAIAGAALAAEGPLFETIPPEASRIVWTHDNGRSEQRYLPESLGPGVAFFDYDGDGWQDLYFVNSGPSDFYSPAKPLANALYRNRGDGTFEDVTVEAGVEGRGFGMGAAAADYDSDGDVDLLVTSYGPVTLYRNQGDGTFVDVTTEVGLEFESWTTSAAWFDADNDGDLDVYVASFVEFREELGGVCGKNKLGKHFYCVPSLFESTASRLYRNTGDGAFERADPGTAIADSLGKGLGVVASDVNGDRRLDLFVANDTEPNFLFFNRGDGEWEEGGLFAGVAYSADGRPRSGMGVDAGDVDGDGQPELFVANVDGELFSLYRNNGDETFADVAYQAGIAVPTRFLSGWGLRFFDYDNDGGLDLFLANGHPDDMVQMYRPKVSYAEPLLLFHGEGDRMHNVSSQAGLAFESSYAARGMATGDYDNDGAVDVVIGVNGGAPLLLRNRAAENNWVGVELVGTAANPHGYGGLVRWSAGGRILERQHVSGGSYLSSHDPRLVLGLGQAPAIDWVEVEWPAPSERVERFTGLATGSYHRLVEGQGTAN